MNRYVLPLVLFAGLAMLLWRGLSLDPREIPSVLIDKSAPAFELEQLHNPVERVSHRTLEGKVWLLNVWASWCVACLQEHSIITELSNQIDIIGLNYKDERSKAKEWLNKHGNPYLISAYDNTGDVGIDYGVYGVPETFVVDQMGQIRYKHIGPVSAEDVKQKLIPIVEQLRLSTN
ncbi:MAG: DsbE family thiol:disulfide interchange protein [bacterium]